MTIYFSIYIPESFTQYLYADNHATNGSFVLLFLCTRKKYMCLSEGEKADIEILLMFLSVNSIPLTFHLYASKLGCNARRFRIKKRKERKGKRKKEQRERERKKLVVSNECCKHKRDVLLIPCNPSNWNARAMRDKSKRNFNKCIMCCKHKQFYVNYPSISLILIISCLIKHEYKSIQLSVILYNLFKYF